jgi:hypothetical protein
MGRVSELPRCAVVRRFLTVFVHADSVDGVVT